MPLELFHELTGASSAKVRRYVSEHYLEDVVAFRNVAFESHAAAFHELGGSLLPSLWTGEQLIEGAEAIIAFLQRLTNIGRAP